MVTFVESQKKCADCIRENLAHCRLTGQVVQSDALAYLRGRSEPRYSIVLADPPYVKQRGPTDLSAYWTALHPWLQPGALVIWEYCSAQEFIGPAESELIWNRHYGETAVAFWRSVSSRG
jgi:16S rRNA G966 N2-methylase RsmD